MTENIFLSSPTTEVNSKILEDLQNDRTNMTSEGCCETSNECKDMDNRQPDINQNGVPRTDSINSGNISPGPFTSFHGLNILAEQMGQDGEGITDNNYDIITCCNKRIKIIMYCFQKCLD